MPLPEKWKHSYIGRKVIHPRTPGITGVVKYARIMRHSIPDGGATECRLSLAFSVEWSDGTTEVVDDAGVASIATDEFVDQPWMLKAVLDIQKVICFVLSESASTPAQACFMLPCAFAVHRGNNTYS